MHREGFAVLVHAVGDRAVRTALDAIEGARSSDSSSDGNSERPDTIFPAQLVAPEDVQRLGRDHVFVAMNYAHACADPEYDMRVIPFIDRVGDDSPAGLHEAGGYYERQAFPARAMRDAGAILAVGSDEPYEDGAPQPFAEMQMAVTRALPGQRPLNAGQALTLPEAIEAFTRNGARALGRESEIGSLAPGKSADFIVLDRDILVVPLSEVGRTRVLQTWFEGRKVYAAD
jgi:hypothetical protein